MDLRVHPMANGPYPQGAGGHVTLASRVTDQEGAHIT